MRRLEQLEKSMGTDDDGPRPHIEIVFVSPDGTKSPPMTLEELQQQYRDRRQSPSSTNAMSEEE
jgi:hypothetical protein